MIVLANDPGLCSGWAVGEASGHLLGCGICSIDDLMLPWSHWTIGLHVVELPQIYPGPQKADANDQITLAVNHGRWVQRVSAPQRRTPHPKQWKGSVPKDIHGRRILAAMTAAERALIPTLAASKLHNAIDAVGLFLWAVGRMNGGR